MNDTLMRIIFLQELHGSPWIKVGEKFLPYWGRLSSVAYYKARKVLSPKGRRREEKD